MFTSGAKRHTNTRETSQKKTERERGRGRGKGREEGRERKGEMESLFNVNQLSDFSAPEAKE